MADIIRFAKRPAPRPEDTGGPPSAVEPGVTMPSPCCESHSTCVRTYRSAPTVVTRERRCTSCGMLFETNETIPDSWWRKMIVKEYPGEQG